MDNKESNDVQENIHKPFEFQIINERPSDMSFEEYKQLRALQKIMLKHKKKGKLVWLSSLKDTPMVRKFLASEGLDNKDKFASLLEKGVSYVKPKENV